MGCLEAEAEKKFTQLNTCRFAADMSQCGSKHSVRREDLNTPLAKTHGLQVRTVFIYFQLFTSIYIVRCSNALTCYEVARHEGQI